MTGPSKFLHPKYFKCPVQYCTTKLENRKGFFIIPEHPQRRQEWLDACGIPSCKNKEVAICWKHFRFQDFTDSGRLKKNVFPTQFPPTFKSNTDSYLELSEGVLGGEAVVDNKPEIPSVPLYHGDPPEEAIIHNEFSNPHDYTPHTKASTTGSAEKGKQWLISNYSHGRY